MAKGYRTGTREQGLRAGFAENGVGEAKRLNQEAFRGAGTRYEFGTLGNGGGNGGGTTGGTGGGGGGGRGLRAGYAGNGVGEARQLNQRAMQNAGRRTGR